jgi:hypothetical protein
VTPPPFVIKSEPPSRVLMGSLPPARVLMESKPPSRVLMESLPPSPFVIKKGKWLVEQPLLPIDQVGSAGR